jgi:hypothetical protein
VPTAKELAAALSINVEVTHPTSQRTIAGDKDVARGRYDCGEQDGRSRHFERQLSPIKMSRRLHVVTSAAQPVDSGLCNNMKKKNENYVTEAF